MRDPGPSGWVIGASGEYGIDLEAELESLRLDEEEQEIEERFCPHREAVE